MREFRDRLLNYLYKMTGESVDITPLVKEYCNISDTVVFDENDGTIRKILAVNSLLTELSVMGWITFGPTGGINTGHTGAQEFGMGKRKLLIPFNVYAKMTMKGEIEYKKIIKEEIRNKEQSSAVANIGNFTGIPIWKLIINKITDNIIALIVAVLAGFIIWKFGWNR